MLNTLRLFHELQTSLDTRAAETIADIIGRVYDDLQNTVTKTEFRELTAIVQDLGEAQKRTEARVEELAEAQKRTETRVEELVEAQKRTETRVEELAEAQKRTEARVEELAEAQKRTEARVEELAEAQKRTEHIVQQLAIRVAENTDKIDDLRTQVGGLSATVGYGLEDKAYHALPRLLRQDFGIETQEPLYRRHVPDNKGKPIEVNIFGAALREGQPIQINRRSQESAFATQD